VSPVPRAILAAAALVAGLLLLLFLAQRKLLYFPARYGLEDAVREAGRLGFEPWRDADGAFTGWRAPHPSGAARARAIVLHGNAGSAIDRGYLRDVIQAPELVDFTPDENLADRVARRLGTTMARWAGYELRTPALR